jgi:hypothetical protein
VTGSERTVEATSDIGSPVPYTRKNAARLLPAIVDRVARGVQRHRTVITRLHDAQSRRVTRDRGTAVTGTAAPASCTGSTREPLPERSASWAI